MHSKHSQVEVAVPDKVYAMISVNGLLCPVTNMFDIDGDSMGDRDTVDMCCSVVAQLPCGAWISAAIDWRELRKLS